MTAKYAKQLLPIPQGEIVYAREGVRSTAHTHWLGGAGRAMLMLWVTALCRYVLAETNLHAVIVLFPCSRRKYGKRPNAISAPSRRIGCQRQLGTVAWPSIIPDRKVKKGLPSSHSPIVCCRG